MRDGPERVMVWRDDEGRLNKTSDAPKRSNALPEIYRREKKKHRLLRLAEAQNWRCCYCGVRMTIAPGKEMVTIEHVIALGEKGTNIWENQAAACVFCNYRRHADIGDEWVGRMSFDLGWRKDFQE